MINKKIEREKIVNLEKNMVRQKETKKYNGKKEICTERERERDRKRKARRKRK